MTRAPENLLALRGLLLAHLNVDLGTVRSQDLEPAEVGIVGDSNHRGGYHCGSDRVVANDYSVVESRRDGAGLTLDAAALDVGLFEVTTSEGTFDLAHFSRWCAAECAKGAPDTHDIREIIYSPDGRVVRRYDRLGYRSTGDSSHLWHTHFSFFRDSIKAGRDQTPLFRRYLTHIGLIEPEDTMSRQDVIDGLYVALVYAADPSKAPDEQAARTARQTRDALRAIVGMEATSPGELAAALSALDPANAEPIISGVLAGLTPEKIAAAIPPTLARQVADELAARLAS